MPIWTEEDEWRRREREAAQNEMGILATVLRPLLKALGWKIHGEWYDEWGPSDTLTAEKDDWKLWCEVRRK